MQVQRREKLSGMLGNKKKEKLSFVAFANFHAVNTPTWLISSCQSISEYLTIGAQLSLFSVS